MLISSGAGVHYDEALGNTGGSNKGGYRVASWIEAVSS